MQDWLRKQFLLQDVQEMAVAAKLRPEQVVRKLN